MGDQVGEWEAGAERRLGIAEKKIDALLDPVDGIYARLSLISQRLAAWAIAILTAIIVSLVTLLATLILVGRPHG